MTKPPTPFPPVTVVHRDDSPLTLEERGVLPGKQWFPLSIRVDDKTLRQLEVLKQRYPTKSQAALVRLAIYRFAQDSIP